MFSFEKLEVYKKSENIYRILNHKVFPKMQDRSLNDQLRRASSSIILNIAEGTGKISKNDKKNFYAIARGSVNECVAILRIIHIEGNIDTMLLNDLTKLLGEIGKMLSGLIRSMKKPL